MEKKEYLNLVKKISPKANIKKTFLCSFFIGGIICAFGEALRQFFLYFRFEEEDAGAMVSFVLIIITAILTGFGIFRKIANIAGAGTFVPITGFANAVVSPALEFKTEGFILGVAAKMFVIAGPVIVYGIFASIVYGAIFYFVKLIGG